mmetsp:Transcript_42750/g.92963  ORF Transcript_42750/g.92963 Transcript_42750/m.92963 type:complete len:279 (+) Transcript_42750:1761-2597(+)
MPSRVVLDALPTDRAAAWGPFHQHFEASLAEHGMAAGHQHHRAGRRQTNDTQPLLIQALHVATAAAPQPLRRRRGAVEAPLQLTAGRGERQQHRPHGIHRLQLLRQVQWPLRLAPACGVVARELLNGFDGQNTCICPHILHFRLALQTVPRRRRCSACAAGAGLIRRRRRIGRVVLAVVVLGVGGGHYLQLGFRHTGLQAAAKQRPAALRRCFLQRLVGVAGELRAEPLQRIGDRIELSVQLFLVRGHVEPQGTAAGERLQLFDEAVQFHGTAPPGRV